MGSKGSKSSSDGTFRLWSDCADSHTDFNFAERTCQLVHYTLGWIPVIDWLITHSCLEA